MAEILIKAVDATHVDPVKDQRGCYKRGDPVDIRPNGFEWGRLEALPPADGGKFVRVRISDVTPAQVETYLTNRWGIALNVSETETVGEDVVVTRRRALRVLVDNLPANVRNQLRNTGFYETTWSAIKSFVQNKLTSETA